MNQKPLCEVCYPEDFHSQLESAPFQGIEVDRSIETMVAPDFVDHTRQIRGPENLKQFLSMIFKGFSDWHIDIEDIIAEGDKVWIRTTVTGTHTGDWMGIAPTGMKFTEHQVWIYRIVEGKVVEGWDVDDDLDFHKQLGVIEYTMSRDIVSFT